MRFSLNGYGKGLGILHPRRLAVGCALLITSLAQAEMSLTLGELVLPPGSTQTTLGKRMRLFGMPVEIRVFDMPVSVDQAARLMTEQYAGLSNIGIYPERVMLSGEIASQYWVVNLMSVGPTRTRGSASVLKDAAIDSRSTATDTAAADGISIVSHAWLPDTAHLKLQLEQDEDGDGGRTLQQVWTFASSVTSAWQAVRRGLLRDQWQLQAETPDTGRWWRERSSLQITITAVDGGSGLLLQQHDGAKF